MAHASKTGRSLRVFFAPIAAIVWLGACAMPMPHKAPPPTEADYRLMPISKALELSNIGRRVRCRVLFEAIEEHVLDLPESYEENWVRLRVGDPADPKSKTQNVVVAANKRAFISRLKPGELIEVLALAVAPDEGFDDQGAGFAVLQVEKIRRPGQLPEAPALARKDGTLVYGNGRDAASVLRLEDSGSFYLKDRGKEISGTYKREGDQVTFFLPSGRTASAQIKDDLLIDPDHKEWFEKNR